VPRTADRNDVVERLLRETHAADGGPTEGPCIGAEELAAWVDGGLAAAEAARVEAHLSSCPTCQALLGAYAAADSDSTSGARRWTRVMLPFAAAAVLVVGVWLAGTTRSDTPVAEDAERQMARLEDEADLKDTRLAAPSPSPWAPSQPAQPAPAPPPAAPGARANEAPSIGSQARSLSARQDAGPAERPPAERSAATSPQLESRQAAATPPPAPAPTADAAGQADLARQPPPARQPELAGAPASTAAPAPQQRARPALTTSARTESALLAKVADARLPIMSPDGATRWRIVGQAIEVSVDGGTSWLPAAGATPSEVADVTGGVSPARSTAWLIGRNGLVLTTADGRTFARATPPVAAPLTVVEAADATSAEVRTADGRSWRTGDAGRSWVRVR
jgi:hypothetical protein